jgi:hypothetical protein
MKHILLFIFLSQLGTKAIGQTEQFESSSAIVENSDFKVERVSRLIVFTETNITISNWLNGGQDALRLKIDRSEDKELSLSGICKWYYCTSVRKDPINGYSKTIIIVPKSKDKIKVYTFADEVTVYHTEILIKKG